MQNPFRHRPQDDFGRREYRDEAGWEARDRRYDEGRSWTEGDGGRTAEAYRAQGQGQYARDEREYGVSGRQSWDQPRYGGPSGDWSGERARAGASYDQYGYGSQPTFGGYDRSQEMRRDARSDYRAGTRHDPAHGYAPGSQIWEGSGRGMGGQTHEHHEFEPDYLHWRQQQLEAFDKDYTSWRDERRQKFSSDFDSWRQNRAANPIVGDVSDGGTGDASELKKR